MCLLSTVGTLRDGSGGVGAGFSQGTALALRSSGCSAVVLLEAGSAITTGGVVLGSCLDEGERYHCGKCGGGG